VFRLLRKRFKLKIEDKLRVNLKHLAYYILAWIVYIDNICKIYKALKVKNKKYLVRIY
jgi:abortive infection bacteriophage resistance protein